MTDLDRLIARIDKQYKKRNLERRRALGFPARGPKPKPIIDEHAICICHAGDFRFDCPYAV
jgi:hypothetical protein